MRITTLRAAAILATVSVSLASCDQIPADQVHQWRAECGRDARTMAAANVAEWRRAQPDWSIAMNSHYSRRDHRCYAELVLFSESPGPKLHREELLDVDENRGVGVFSEQMTPERDVRMCSLADQKCASYEEWQTLVKPYMEQ